MHGINIYITILIVNQVSKGEEMKLAGLGKEESVWRNLDERDDPPSVFEICHCHWGAPKAPNTLLV